MTQVNTTSSPAGILRWLTDRPARSFTLFKGHPGMVRIARLVERVVFLGGAAVAVLLTLGGWLGLVGLLERLIELKVTALIFSQVAHVFVNVVRYILVPADRTAIRAANVKFHPRPDSQNLYDPTYIHDSTLDGFPKPADYIRPNQVPTSSTVNIPSADYGVPDQFTKRS